MKKTNNKDNNKTKNRKILSANNIKNYLSKELNHKDDKLNSLTTKNFHLKNRELIRPSTTFLSTNINNYRYLFDNNNKETIYSAKWVVNLRSFNTFKAKKLKLLGEPHFYQEDLQKYISKKKNKIQRSKSAFDFESFPNLNKYKHFFKINNNNHGTYINRPLLNYNLSLRQNNIKILNKWNSNTNLNKNKYFFSCINLSKEEIKGKINDKYIMRPYKIEYTKDDYYGNKILKKTYIRDKKKAFNVFGEHYSLTPYNDKYSEKNYGTIHELLNYFDKTQGRTWFQIKLRNENDKNENENKIQKNKNKWKNY